MSAPVTIRALAPAARFMLRAEDDGAPVGAIAQRGAFRALKLGPDEWMLEGPDGAAPDAPDAWSLVDVTDREIGFVVEGPEAATLIATACPRDLRAFAPGRCARTLFAELTVVLIRDSDTRFTLLCWRSFAGHMQHHLEAARRELEAGL